MIGIIVNVIFVIGCLIAYFASAVDAFYARREKVSWISVHRFRWFYRDIPLILILILLIMIMFHYQYWVNLFHISIIVLIRCFHRRIILYYENRLDDYFGEWQMPDWFKKLRRLWSWALFKRL